MEKVKYISTGIEGLDKTLDYLRWGDTVTWQIENMGDYVFVVSQLVASVARTKQRIVYLRFADHAEVVDDEALIKRGANVKKYVLDPAVGFETFSVQIHRIVSAEPEDSIFITDCLSCLQHFWFSDHMVCNFFCLTSAFSHSRNSIAYTCIKYERHIYDTVSRIRATTPVLINIRNIDGSTYIHPVKVAGRQTEDMYYPIKLEGSHCRTLTSSAELYAIFDIFTQTGERRDCWDSMFDSVKNGNEEPVDEEGRAIKENILRCLLGNEPKRLALCRKYFSMHDLMDIKKRVIGTGCIGGKAVGMLLARNIIRDTDPELYKKRIEPHDSYFIGADVFYTYAVQSGIWELRTQMLKPEDYLRLSPELKQLLLNGSFMPAIKEQFLSMLEYFGQSPIIVRSSSLLEDGFGNAFAGKYDSVFCPNQGTLDQRYRQFEAAVRQVYASTVSEEAYKYRIERNLLDRDEQMALLVMRVCGDRHGRYYYPHVAGVGHSQNLYVNSLSAAKGNKGMLRLVFGMGTRAVDREAEDYARLINLDEPLAPPMVNYGDEYKYSQHSVDLIDLRYNTFTNRKLEELDRKDMGTDTSLFMEPDMATIARYRELGIYDEPAPFIINFRRMLRGTDFTQTMTRIMAMLQEKYSYPVDVEYACNFNSEGDYRVNLLQCRPLQTHGLGQAGVMPKVKDFLFRIKGNFMGGNICVPVRYGVLVKVEPYLELPEGMKYSVARAVGKLNAKLKDKNAVLLGPGRWGTTTPSLGVPVSFAEISKFQCMCELAYSSHGLRPELSYGSHFFQDLVESGIYYAAVYQGEKGCVFNEALFDSFPDRFLELGGDENLKGVVKVYDFGKPGAILYGEIASQDCFLGLLSE